MSRSARHLLTAFGVLACVSISAAAQQESAGTPRPADANPAKLAGTWSFDDGASREDHRNWRRPVGNPQPMGNPSTGTGGVGPRRTGGGGMPAGGGGTGGGGWGGGDGFIPRPTSSTFDTELRRVLRDLLEVAETYEIELRDGQVVITDDLERSLTFSTSGRKEKHRLGATSFDAKTSWEGALLKQDIESIGGFRMSQVFLPTEDGSSMFVSIRVEKPEFTPPIKPITRTYRRSN